jgi:hypothetical protein
MSTSLENQRAIGALEAGVKGAAEMVSELRALAIDQLSKTAAIEQRMVSLEAELSELREEYSKARGALIKLAIIVGTGGAAAGGGLTKLLSVFAP